MGGKILVNLEESRHISIIGSEGSGKTTYIRGLVEDALRAYPDLEVCIFGARDKKWEELAEDSRVAVYSFEGTLKDKLTRDEYPTSEKPTLIVLDDVDYTVQMLPREEREAVAKKLYKLLIGENSENTYSIVSSLRPLATYYPPELLELANTKIALRLEVGADYTTFFETKEYKATGDVPNAVSEAYIDTKNTNGAVFIESVEDIELK